MALSLDGLNKLKAQIKLLRLGALDKRQAAVVRANAAKVGLSV